MSILLLKVLWYRLTEINTEALSDNDYGTPVNITDIINFSAGKGIDIKNNILSFTVRNPHSNYVDSTSNEIKFSEQDQVKVYAKYTDDGADLSSSSWSTTSTDEPSTEFLVGTFYVVEFSVNHATGSTQIQVKCADKTYILFNRVLAYAFTKSQGKTIPQMLQKVIRLACQTDNPKGAFLGTGEDSGVYYEVDAKLASEGGYITDTRKSTREDGTVNTDLAFPQKEFAKVWKPIYEWIQELSQVEKTNTTSELAGTTALVYGRPFIFWVDEGNHFHWVYPTDTVTDYIETGKFYGATLSYDSTQTNNAEVYSVQMVKRVFDVTNMIIYNAGDDMYKVGIWGYEVDTTSRTKTLKMRVVPMTDIAEKWKNDDYTYGIVEANREGTPAGYPLYQFPVDGQYAPGLSACVFVPTDTYATASTITNDTKYNDALRERCLSEGSNRAKALLAGLSEARWKGSVTTKGKSYSVGNLVEFSDTSIGIYREKLRIMDLKHNITTKSWTTQLSLEKDPQAVEVQT